MDRINPWSGNNILFYDFKANNMNKELKSIMLIDDNPDDNFIHERAIKKINSESVVITKLSGADALSYLKSRETPCSDLIFLDINMPEMNGWEFLERYRKLDK